MSSRPSQLFARCLVWDSLVGSRIDLHIFRWLPGYILCQLDFMNFSFIALLLIPNPWPLSVVQ